MGSYLWQTNPFILIEQVETLLKTQDPVTTTSDTAPTSFVSSLDSANEIGLQNISAADFGVQNPSIGLVNGVNDEQWHLPEEPSQQPMEGLGFSGGDLSMNMGLDMSTFTWEMIGLGLEEPLPPQETIDELYVVGHPQL